MFEKIIEEIKKYNHITIARHIGPDFDALGSQYALGEAIKRTFPEKSVYLPGTFNQKVAQLYKSSEPKVKELLIILDTPNLSRVDIKDITGFKSIVKIDHHPFIEKFSEIEYINTEVSSTSEIIYNFLKFSNFDMNKRCAELLFMGIITDTNRFLFSLGENTLYLAGELVDNFKIDTEKLYKEIYKREYKIEKFKAWVTVNYNVTDNNFAYIFIKDKDLKEFDVDAGSGGNFINDYTNIEEFLSWCIITEDLEKKIYRVNIRSKGPVINKIAEKYNGGGHPMASGARIPLDKANMIDDLIKDLDDATKLYKEALWKLKV